MSKSRDWDVLRRLAEEVQSISELPKQQETKELWKHLNSLRPQRPMVLIDQICWHEMNVDDELTLQTEDPFLQRFEDSLRKTIYQWKHLPVDMVVEPYIEVPPAVTGLGYGLRPKEDRAVTDERNSVVGHHYHDQLSTEDDLEKLKTPSIQLDDKETHRRMEMAAEIFDGRLDVVMQGFPLNFAIWDRLVELRGVTNPIMDLIDRPDFMHATLRKMTDITMAMLAQLEDLGLLPSWQPTIHCSGAHVYELPAPGYDPGHPRTKDIWTSGMAQIFATVSPAMHKEFELDYAETFYARHGLVYYGCCEPLDRKMGIVRTIPNLRKVSMSPWTNAERGAAAIGGDLVLSRKPSPAFLAGDGFDIDAIEEDLRETMEICQRHSTPVEFILKDISTVSYQPERLWQWAEVAMKIVME